MESLANVLVAIESNPAKLFYKNSTAFNLSFLVYIPTSNLLYLGQILSVPPNVEMTVGDTAMQANKWISGKYWVGASGAMATNSWIDGENTILVAMVTGFPTMVRAQALRSKRRFSMLQEVVSIILIIAGLQRE